MPTQAKRALKNPLQKALWRPKNGERTRGKGIKSTREKLYKQITLILKTNKEEKL